MQPVRFEHSSIFSCPAVRLWAFHMRPDALNILSPPGTRVVDPGDGVADGSVVTLAIGWWPLAFTWKALHTGVRPPSSFTDVAIESPFAFWAHQHEIETLGTTSSRLRDVVHYLPPRWLPRWLGVPATRLGLRVLFAWRHRRTRRAVARNGSPAVRARLFDQPVSGGA